MHNFQGIDKPQTKDNPETRIQKEVLDWLEDLEGKMKKPIYYFRSGAGAVRIAGGGFFRTGRPGCPDITVAVAGRFVGIELKAPGKKQSKEQKEAEKLIQRAGADYFVAYSLTDVKKILSSYIDIF